MLLQLAFESHNPSMDEEWQMASRRFRQACQLAFDLRDLRCYALCEIWEPVVQYISQLTLMEDRFTIPSQDLSC